MPDTEFQDAVTSEYFAALPLTPGMARALQTEANELLDMMRQEGWQIAFREWDREAEQALDNRLAMKAEELSAARKRAAALRAVASLALARVRMGMSREVKEKAKETPAPADEADRLQTFLLQSMTPAPPKFTPENAAFAAKTAEAIRVLVAHPGWARLMRWLSALSVAHEGALADGTAIDDEVCIQTVRAIPAPVAKLAGLLALGANAEVWTIEQGQAERKE